MADLLGWAWKGGLMGKKTTNAPATSFNVQGVKKAFKQAYTNSLRTIISSQIYNIFGVSDQSKVHKEKTSSENYTKKDLTRTINNETNTYSVEACDGLTDRQTELSPAGDNKLELELSSDNHLVDGPTDRQTDRPTDMSKEIYPLFFEGGHKYLYVHNHIIGTNLLTKFHEDRKINVAFRVLTRKNAPPPGSHFHEDRTVNVASRVKNAQPLGSHFHDYRTIDVASRPYYIKDIIGMNLLTEFHEDGTINVASRVLTRFYYSHTCIYMKPYRRKCPATLQPYWTINVASIEKNAPPPGGLVFQPKGIIFELVQDIIGMNLLIKFHEDWTINLASRVLTRFYYSHIRKNAPPLGSHVFQAKVTIFKLIQDIIGTNLLTKFHEDRNINMASRVLTRFYNSHIRKNAPPPGGHVF
ncbi:hypothetical protein DPMN_017074 [Dreissena polymorpha]|uniref:Uncharacterized protein n=1 Tax=Dreissena polymorpha TaxID=45954 RepID=A0A9D4NAS5_DREPO|nr:hypothetical protein DPMN_017074 [Dreissena polymorpha]